jgi:hypothetical protein
MPAVISSAAKPLASKDAQAGLAAPKSPRGRDCQLAAATPPKVL